MVGGRSVRVRSGTAGSASGIGREGQRVRGLDMAESGEEARDGESEAEERERRGRRRLLGVTREATMFRRSR